MQRAPSIRDPAVLAGVQSLVQTSGLLLIARDIRPPMP